MDKSREAVFIIIIGIIVVFIVKGHELDGRGELPDFLKPIFTLGKNVVTPKPDEKPEITGVSATEVIAVPKLVLPAYAMVNETSTLLHPTTKKPLGEVKQGTVVDAQKQKGDDILIYIDGVEGLLPFGNLTFRR
ncbi:MAG: hypothetical protein VX730_09335 [Pseudomonadota bacterium]|nr:hypothetical protein [Pseudomonadota bacterium]